MKKLTPAEEVKLHNWYTDVWNTKAADSNEPGWVMIDEWVKLVGVDAIRATLSKM